MCRAYTPTRTAHGCDKAAVDRPTAGGARTRPSTALVYAARRDRELDPRAVSECIRRAQQAWSDRGAADGIEYRSPDDIGRFQKAQQEMFLSWLRSQD